MIVYVEMCPRGLAVVTETPCARCQSQQRYRIGRNEFRLLRWHEQPAPPDFSTDVGGHRWFKWPDVRHLFEEAADAD